VAVADLTGNGISDLVVPSQHGNVGTVDILLGNGDGTFQPPVSYPAGASAFSAAVGDFDGDGTPDLAVSDPASNTVNILLGNGGGSFQAPVSYPTGSDPLTVLAADLTGNGILDLAVANESSNTVSSLLGNGDGSFQPAQSYSAGTQLLNGMALGDFNGDGSPDLVCADYHSPVVTVLLGNGDGSFQAPVSYPAGPSGLAYSVTVGDFDGDGILDLAVANPRGFSEGMVSILRGNSDGSFQAPVSYPTGNQNPVSVAVADFNGDGIADLAVVNSNGEFNSNVGVLLGNGDGSFQAATTYSVGDAPSGVAVGDFNGDGFPDLAVADTNGGNFPGSVSVLINAADWGGGPAPARPPRGQQGMALLGSNPALGAGDPAQLSVPDHRGVVRYASTVTFSTSDEGPGVVLPDPHLFTGADGGTHPFTGAFVLLTSGPQMLWADDTDGGFCISAVLTVQDGGAPKPAPYGAAEGREKWCQIIFSHLK
jgi:hypothetical protein